MPASLKDLRTRIKSIKNTQQITKAMKLVSAAKFGRAQHTVVHARPYCHSLHHLLNTLCQDPKILPVLKQHAYFSPGLTPAQDVPDGCAKAVFLFFFSHRGLCGGYNANLFKKSIQILENFNSNNVLLVCLGRKGMPLFNRWPGLKQNAGHTPLTTEEFFRDFDHLSKHSSLLLINDLPQQATIPWAQHWAQHWAHLFTAQSLSSLHCIYNGFQSALTQTPTHDVMLPLALPTETGPHNGATNPVPTQVGKGHFPNFVEPTAEIFVDAFTERYLTSRIFEVFASALASEHGARMNAMDNATRNGREMEKKLQINYQRARQAAITKELIEIISGAEAL